MNELSKLPKLIPLNEGDGAYCDVETGECYPATSHQDSAPVAVDPVCKTEIGVKTARHKIEYQRQTYYFCSLDCREAFEKEPQRYLASETRASV
ncbi:MAG TPA: YHS domain-containing protein [Longilinea sp.]|nr:YHS domain-containing protein [Longilinea sp.]